MGAQPNLGLFLLGIKRQSSLKQHSAIALVMSVGRDGSRPVHPMQPHWATHLRGIIWLHLWGGVADNAILLKLDMQLLPLYPRTPPLTMLPMRGDYKTRVSFMALKGNLNSS